MRCKWKKGEIENYRDFPSIMTGACKRLNEPQEGHVLVEVYILPLRRLEVTADYSRCIEFLRRSLLYICCLSMKLSLKLR